VKASALRVYLVALRVGSPTRNLDSSERSRLNLVGQPLCRDCCPDSSWGLRRSSSVCREGTTGLALGDFKFPVTVLYLAYQAPV